MSSNVPIIDQLIKSKVGLVLNSPSHHFAISVDHIGLLRCDNLEIAQHALLQTDMELTDAEAANLDDFVTSSSQFQKVGIIRQLGEFNWFPPSILKLIEAVKKSRMINDPVAFQFRSRGDTNLQTMMQSDIVYFIL